MFASYLPDLGVGTQALFRSAYGVLLLIALLRLVGHDRRFFVSERYGGYVGCSLLHDRFHTPVLMRLTLGVWGASAIGLIIGVASPWFGLLNVVLCRYFFVSMRWNSLLRGMGAPGFMLYWTGLVVFLLECTAHYAPELRNMALLVAQVDFALIFLSAGVYKLVAGYARNDGMNFGLVNPAWGYWSRQYQRLPPDHRAFVLLNHLGWSTEILAAALMLVPQLRFIGGLIILVTFAFVATQIRLGTLCSLVMVCSLLFFGPATQVGAWTDYVGGYVWPSSAPPLQPPAVLNAAMAVALWAYLLLLPVVHAGISFNFYAKRAFRPRILQRLLDRYANLFGIIIWRVFSIDHLNFFIRIYALRPHTRERALLNSYGLKGSRRYNEVAESITLTTLFTTLKYYPSNWRLFSERLLRYARTVQPVPRTDLIFEYVSIRRGAARFEMVPVAEYRVTADTANVEEHLLVPYAAPRMAAPLSPVHEGQRPGSYAPLVRPAR